MVVKALDAIKSNDDDDNWSAKHNAEMAQKYKLEIMSRRGSEEDQIKFMYDNVSNPDFVRGLFKLYGIRQIMTRCSGLPKKE